MLTAVEQAFEEDRSASASNPGTAATSTPFSISASVTLKSAGSNVLAHAPAVTVLNEINNSSFIVVTSREVPC